MSVREVFEAGVSGAAHEPTATDISRSANSGYESHAARVEAQLDKVRSATAKVLATEDDRADEIANLADKAIDAIAESLDAVEDARAKAEKARVEVGAKYNIDLPGIDKANLSSLRAQAQKATAEAVMQESAPSIDASAATAGAACSALEVFVELSNATSPELDEALDAKFTPNDRASEDVAVEQLSARSCGALRSFYANAVAAKMDEKRLRRLERALERVARARLGLNDVELGKLTYSMGGTTFGADRTNHERDTANALLSDIAGARSRRTPVSVGLAQEELVPALREAFRLLCGSDKVHFESTGQSTGEVLAKRAPWKPLPEWQRRYELAK